MNRFTSTFPRLETERLILRPLGHEDFPAMAEFYGSERSRFVGGIVDPAKAWRQLATEIGHWTLRGYGRFGVELREGSSLVGVIGPWFPHGWPEPELGWDLMAGFEGKGYASEAARATRDWAYGSLGWTTATSLVAPENKASEAVAKRLGCTYECDIEHATAGHVSIWRHPGPDA